MKSPFVILLGIIALASFSLSNGSLFADDHFSQPVLKKSQGENDPFYGTEHDFYLSVPGHFVRYIHANCSGTYEGIGVFGGDRRFDPFHRHYSLVIEDKFADGSYATIITHRIQVAWKSFTTVSSANDKTHGDDKAEGDTIDNIDYNVKDAYFDGINLWGNMSYQTTKGESVVKMPFLAIRGHQTDEGETEGILLLGRYEGPVFLKKVN